MPRVRVIKVQPDKPVENPPPVQAEPPEAPEIKAPEPKPEVSEQPTADPAVRSGDGIVISKKVLIRIIVGVLILLLLVVAFVNRETANVPKVNEQKSGQTEVQNQANKYTKELSVLIDLPKDQTPTLSIVSDLEKFKSKSPALFKNAELNDVLLVYLNEDKTAEVVLYRPTTKKIILYLDGADLGAKSSTPDTQN